VPAAEGAALPVFSAVFADVGDEQSIERNLSTFSAHVANLCEVLAAVGGQGGGPRRPLVLLDEPGVGTDPEEGAALAIGLLQELERLGARVVVTTHYTPVKLFAAARPGYAVAAVDFDVELLLPHYRLQYGSLGRSLALPIAQRLGLPAEVLEAARASQSEATRTLDAALAELQRNRRELEALTEAERARAVRTRAQEQEAERLARELRERRRDVWNRELREAREFVRRVKAEGREVVETLRKDARRRPEAGRAIRSLEAEIEQREAEVGAASARAEVDVLSGTPQVGDDVVDGEHGIRGKLLAVDGERAWLQRGSMRFEVPSAQLRRVDGGGAKAAAPPVRVHLEARDESGPSEISLLGLRTRDAIARLDEFLDRAVQARHPGVRIVHGFGSGALRRAVRDYLAASPYCSEFREGEPQEGGGGVTIATLAL